MNAMQAGFGTLEIITGCMFSDKSSTLIRKLRRGRYEKKKVAGIKPVRDSRYSVKDIASHGGTVFTAVPVTSSKDILSLAVVLEADIVGIDEGQFFDATIVDVCQTLVAMGKQVIVAGLDQDSTGRSFGPMPELMAQADIVTKVHAACTVCGSSATKSQRVVDNDAQVLVGGKEAYEARCRKHWSPKPVFVTPDSFGEQDD